MKDEQTADEQSVDEQTLTVFPLLSHSIYPHTFFLIKPGQSQKTLIEKICRNDPPQCMVVVQNLDKKKTDPDSFDKIGIVSTVEVDGEAFKFSAKWRAEIKSLSYYPKQGIWKADVLRLLDSPELTKLTDDHHDLPMIFGAMESILRLLLDLKNLVKRGEDLADRLDEQIKKLKQTRREKETAYSLPWHVLIDFQHLAEEVKGKMLKTDSVMERLQFLIDILKSEKTILINAQVLAEDDPEGLGKNGGK